MGCLRRWRTAARSWRSALALRKSLAGLKPCATLSKLIQRERTTSMDAVLQMLADNESRYFRELAEFVGIPSVSTDPAHAGDVRRAAEWVAARLRRAGDIEVEVWETPRHPAVFGRWNGAPGAPTVLVYGHVDVQPPDPIEAWDSPPFVLTERNGRLYGRGVSDDKASMLLPILAAEAFFAAGQRPPVNLRFLFEAEEEIGSPDLPGLVRARRDALACDVALSADGGMWRADVPSITVSARGLVSLAFTVRGPQRICTRAATAAAWPTRCTRRRRWSRHCTTVGGSPSTVFTTMWSRSSRRC